jgi:hypothetical protein
MGSLLTHIGLLQRGLCEDRKSSSTISNSKPIIFSNLPPTTRPLIDVRLSWGEEVPSGILRGQLPDSRSADLRDNRPLPALSTFQRPEPFYFRLILLRTSSISSSSLLSVDMPTGPAPWELVPSPGGDRINKGNFDMAAVNLPIGFRNLVL